jgi:hypothetical protein
VELDETVGKGEAADLETQGDADPIDKHAQEPVDDEAPTGTAQVNGLAEQRKKEKERKKLVARWIKLAKTSGFFCILQFIKEVCSMDTIHLFASCS